MEPLLKSRIFKVFRFYTASTPRKKCSEEPHTSADNPTTASENKAQKAYKYPFGMLYNAIDDLEDKLLRKLRNSARLMKTKRKEACIGG